MITVVIIGKVKRIFSREKKSVRVAVRLTSLSRNTGRKWLSAPVLDEPRYRRSQVPGKLTAYRNKLELAVRADLC